MITFKPISYCFLICKKSKANMRHRTNVVLVLVHRLRLRANIKTTLAQCLSFSRVPSLRCVPVDGYMMVTWWLHVLVWSAVTAVWLWMADLPWLGLTPGLIVFCSRRVPGPRVSWPCSLVMCPYPVGCWSLPQACLSDVRSVHSPLYCRGQPPPPLVPEFVLAYYLVHFQLKIIFIRKK